MNTQKAVYNRLFVEAKKTKLESQKIELSLADDVQDILSKAEKELKESEKLLTTSKKNLEALNKAQESLSKIENTLKTKSSELDKLSDTAQRISMKAEDLADELGLNTSSIKGFSKLEKIIFKLINVSGDLEDVFNKII